MKNSKGHCLRIKALYYIVTETKFVFRSRFTGRVLLPFLTCDTLYFSVTLFYFKKAKWNYFVSHRCIFGHPFASLTREILFNTRRNSLYLRAAMLFQLESKRLSPKPLKLSLLSNIRKNYAFYTKTTPTTPNYTKTTPKLHQNYTKITPKLHQNTPKLHLLHQNYTKTTPTAPKLHQNYTKLHQTTPNYTKLHQNYTKLHQNYTKTTPNYTKLHQTTPNYTKLYQTTPTTPKLH